MGCKNLEGVEIGEVPAGDIFGLFMARRFTNNYVRGIPSCSRLLTEYDM